MSYSFATGGSGWEMIPCGVALLAEIKQCVTLGLLDVTNLGQIGDATHQAEPTSRHNPARAPNGTWYVCAADFGGRDYPKLAEFHRARWNAHDPRIWPYGFSQLGDGRGLSWDTGQWKWTGRDQGHAHLDFTMKHGSLSSDWWVPALMDTSPWGLESWLRGGDATPPDESVEDDMPFWSSWPQSEKDQMRADLWSTGIAVPGGMEPAAVTLGNVVDRTVSAVNQRADANRNALAEWTRNLPALNAQSDPAAVAAALAAALPADLAVKVADELAKRLAA